MAWVVTALFVPRIIGLSYLVFSPHREHVACSITFIALLSICVSLFVWKQFQLRSDAADTIAVMINIVNKLCINENYLQTLTQEELEVEQPYNPDKPWPKFIQNEKKDGKAKNRGRSKCTKICTDLVSYTALGLSVLIALYIVIFGTSQPTLC